MNLLLLAAVALVGQGPVTGDFDRDGRPDVAELRATTGGEAQLVVSRASGQTVVLAEPLGPRSNFYLAKAAPGVRRTVCGKGAGPKTAACRPTVTLASDTLVFGTREASEAVAIWNGRTFEVEWLSD